MRVLNISFFSFYIGFHVAGIYTDPVVRYQMNLSFSSEEAKENFLTSLEKIKKIFSRRSLRQLDNLELLQSLFDYGGQ